MVAVRQPRVETHGYYGSRVLQTLPGKAIHEFIELMHYSIQDAD